MSAIISGYGSALLGGKIPNSVELRCGIDRGVHQGPLPSSLADIPLAQLEGPRAAAPSRSSTHLGCWSRTDNQVIDDEEESDEADDGPRVARNTLPRAKRRSSPKTVSSSLTPEQRSEAISKAGRERWAALTPEQRAELGQRSLRARLAKNPKYVKSAGQKRLRRPTGFAAGSEDYRAHMRAKGVESAARRTPEERSASALKSAATRRAKDLDSKRQMAKTPEHRQAMARSGAHAMHAARRARLAAEALPETKTLTTIARCDTLSIVDDGG